VKHFFKVVLLAITFCLAACSTLQGDKVDYKSATKAVSTSLEVPPDLTQLNRETRFIAPGTPVAASALQGNSTNTTSPTAAVSVGDVRIERNGTQRWLVVDRPAEKLWDPVKEFWQQNGFVLSLDQASLGIMETDWAENRAKLPQDIIRRTLGKVFDSIYSTGERDKFRTRLERNGNTTEIYITHRGLEEVYKTAQKDSTIWQPRAADPELETEFMRRLMIKLGVSQEQAKVQLSGVTVKLITRVSTLNGLPVVEISEPFDRAWRRVGLSLDRTGFTVEDRDRSQGTYFVRYVEPGSNSEEPGFFKRLFSASPKPAQPQQFKISVVTKGDLSTVTVQERSGQTVPLEVAQRIVKVLAEDMK
jgi:outer membrane protein assembly factor BamC